MTAPRRYSYKPAALRGAVSCALDGDRLALDTDWRLELSAVGRVAFVNHVLKGARLMRLDLWAGETRRSLSYTGAAKSWQADPDAAVFLRLTRDVLRALPPSTPVALGETGRPRLVMFAIGLLSILAGGGIFIAALASGIAADRLAAAAVPMGLLGVLGALLAWGYAPWRRLPSATPEALAKVIDDILNGLPAT